MKYKSDIGVFGLGVMGQNLALNLEGNGYRVSVYNRMEGEEKQVIEEFMSHKAVGKQVAGTRSVEEFLSSLQSPRVILLMVSAGPAVDAVINQLKPHLGSGDIIIDGGNSHFEDTRTAVQRARKRRYSPGWNGRFRWRGGRTIWSVDDAGWF